jgi:hypothetical protein
MSNLPALSATYYEVRLKDDLTGGFTTLNFPDPKANVWVRHRQEVLFQGLEEDQPIQTGGTEKIYAKKTDMEEYWEMDQQAGMNRLKKVPAHLVPRTGAMRPSDWSQARLRSYMRYICRVNKVKSVELIRHSKVVLLPMILPSLMLRDEPPAPEQGIVAVNSHFGEYPREK